MATQEKLLDAFYALNKTVREADPYYGPMNPKDVPEILAKSRAFEDAWWEYVEETEEPWDGFPEVVERAPVVLEPAPVLAPKDGPSDMDLMTAIFEIANIPYSIDWEYRHGWSGDWEHTGIQTLTVDNKFRFVFCDYNNMRTVQWHTSAGEIIG